MKDGTRERRSCGVLIGVMLCAAVSGCGRKSVEEVASPEAPRVKAVAATLRHWPQVIRVQGSLRADELAIVGAKVAGRVKTVHVDIGSVVRKGDPLMGLDMEDMELRIQQADAQLAQARARLGLSAGDDETRLDPAKIPTVLQEKAVRDEARLKYKRAESLTAFKAVAMEEVEERQAALGVAEAKYQSALNAVAEDRAMIQLKRADLALARQARDDAMVRAPFDGIIEERQVAPGVYVQIGQPVVTLVRTNPVRFRAGVPEREAGRLKLKQEVHVKVEGQGDTIVGQVSRISPALDTASRALAVEVDVPNPTGTLRAGLFAEAEIFVDAKARVLAVPASAIDDFAGIDKVWFLSGDKAAPRTVRTGRRTEGWVEILDGLASGDWVAEDGRKTRPGSVVVERPEIATAAVGR